MDPGDLSVTSSWLRGDNNHPSITNNKKRWGGARFFFTWDAIDL
jgi:hypothetical protein